MLSGYLPLPLCTAGKPKGSLDANCRVTTNPTVKQAHSTGGHDSWVP